MKTVLKLAFSSLLFGLAAMPALVRAEDNMIAVPVEQPAAEAAKPDKANGKRVRDQVEQHDKMLVEKLKLTAEQQGKLTALRKEQANQLKAARGDRPKMAGLLKSSRDQVRALLTPEQQKEFDAMPAESHMGKGKGKGRKAQP